MIVGITGGIATGKSTVTRLLADLGAVTFSADEASRAILYKDGPALFGIVKRFGSDVLLPDGTLNRKVLGQIVFADSEKRNALNQIMHPLIRRLLWDQIESAKIEFPHGIIGVEVPLLFEGNLQNWFERIIVVASSEPVQIRRLTARDRLTPEEAIRRIKAQFPLAEKVKRATYVVVNDGTLADLTPQVEALWSVLHSPSIEHGLSTN